jgi:large subunit ribosomal protein L19
MKQNKIVEEYVAPSLKKNIPDFKVGDTVRVHTKIIEGDKERVQIFTGTVIARKGAGVSETFKLHRSAYGVSMQRDFPIHSPRVQKIEVERSGKTRKAKLYYLTKAKGKAARIEENIDARISAQQAASAPSV